MDILFKVIKRELLENNRAEKAVRVILECGEYITPAERDAGRVQSVGKYSNEFFLDMNFSVLLPASEYDNYPIGSEYLLTPVKNALFKDIKTTAGGGLL